MTAPRYASRVPSAPLDRFVAAIWANERPALAHPKERLLPTGRADVVFALGGTTLRRAAAPDDPSPRSFRLGLVSGPADHAVFRDTSTHASVVGIHFRPAGLAVFVDAPIDRLAGGSVSVEDLFGRFAIDARERLDDAPSPEARLRLLEQLLLARLMDREPPDPVAFHAARAIEADPGSVRIGDLVRASGYSPGTFIARFARTVGLSPKRFARVARLQRAIDLLRRGDGRLGSAAFVAGVTGYADQAHLVREMRALTGLTPTSYLPATGHPNHVAEVAAGKFFKPAGSAPG